MDFMPGYSFNASAYKKFLAKNEVQSQKDSDITPLNLYTPVSGPNPLSPFGGIQQSFSQSFPMYGYSADLMSFNVNLLLTMLMNMLQLMTVNAAQGNTQWSLGNQFQATNAQNTGEQLSTATTKTTQAASGGALGTTKAKDALVTGTNYYVDSVNGSDSNDGLSPDKPLKSLDKVNQLDLKPGDGINFAKGSTFNGELEIKNSGTEDKPIVYRAYGTGNAPVFKNSGDGWKIAINVTGSHNVLDGLKMQDATIGVQFADGANGNTLQNSEATNVGRGVDVEGDGNTINSNYFHDLKMVINTVGGNDDNGANGVVIHSSNTTIENNRFERNIASSHDYGQDGGAVEIYAFKDKAVNNTVIRGNTVSDSDGFIEVGADGRTAVNNTLIENNTSTNNGLFSVIHNAAMSKASDEDNAVINNYIVQNNTITEKNTDPDSLFIDGGTIKDNKYQKPN